MQEYNETRTPAMGKVSLFTLRFYSPVKSGMVSLLNHSFFWAGLVH